MKVTLELGKMTGMAQVCWKQHEFELAGTTWWTAQSIYFCRKCGAKVVL